MDNILKSTVRNEIQNYMSSSYVGMKIVQEDLTHQINRFQNQRSVKLKDGWIIYLIGFAQTLYLQIGFEHADFSASA